MRIITAKNLSKSVRFDSFTFNPAKYKITSVRYYIGMFYCLVTAQLPYGLRRLVEFIFAGPARIVPSKLRRRILRRRFSIDRHGRT